MARNFELGHHVLLYNSRLMLFPHKLKSRWPCPFTDIQVFQHGAMEIGDKKIGIQFRVNRQRLKRYFGRDWIRHFSTIGLAHK